MNLSLIAHIMNQRLQKGEIWPPWWDGKLTSPATWLSLLPLVGIPVLVIVPVPWVSEIPDAVIILGRGLFLVSLGIMAVDAIFCLGSVYRSLRQVSSEASLQLMVLAHRSPREMLLEWLVADVATLGLRMLRYVPFGAIAVVASALTWSDCVRVLAIAFMMAMATLAILYGASITLPRTNLAPVLVALLVILWFLFALNPFFFTFTRLRYAFVSYTLQLFAATCAALVIAALVLSTRTLHPRMRRKARWRIPFTHWLRFMPGGALLLRGIQEDLGILGATTLWLVSSFLSLAIASIPWLGWLVVLVGATAMVAPLMRSVWNSRAWDDVCLASTTPEALRRHVTSAVFIVFCPSLPGLLVALIIGRTTFEQHSALAFARQLNGMATPLNEMVFVVVLVLLDFVFAVLVFGACVLAALDSWADDTINQSLHSSRKEVTLIALAFVVLAMLNFATLVSDSTFLLIVLFSPMGIVSLVAGIITAFAWRNLRSSLPCLVGTTTDDFAEQPTRYIHL